MGKVTGRCRCGGVSCRLRSLVTVKEKNQELQANERSLVDGSLDTGGKKTSQRH